MSDDTAERIAQLETENRRLVAMLDALDDHVLLLDPRFRFLFLNRASEGVNRSSFAAASRDEMIGRSALDGSHAQEFKDYLHGLFSRAAQGETVGEEFLLPTPDGAVWHEHYVHPVRGPGGEVEAVAISSREIQARKLAEGRLQLLSKIGLLAGATKMDGLLARAAGLAVPELADWTIFELVADGTTGRATVTHLDAEAAADAARTLTAAPRPVPAGTGARIIRDDDGALGPVLARFGATTAIVVPFVVDGETIALATFAYGRESGRLHVEQDLVVANEVAGRAAQIVENARLRLELEQALAYRERMMGILSHDLRNPVSAVMSLAETLRRRADIPERSKLGLQHIRSAAERMDQMIGTLLDFTQLRSRGVLVLARETFDLEQLARGILDELRAANPDRDIALDARGALRGRWDVGRMGQVIANLVGNALAHGAADAPIKVSLASDNDEVFLAVSNRGPTIPTAALSKLFEPFWQGARASKSRGLGLGLFIVQQIVHAHGATIAVRSEDEQTTFTVRLPRG